LLQGEMSDTAHVSERCQGTARGISDCGLCALVETMLKLRKDLPAPRVGGGFEHKEVA